VHVSFSDRPLSLKAEGLSGSLRLLEQDLKDFMAVRHSLFVPNHFH